MHADEELLSLLALGESDAADAEQLDHIAHCLACAGELAKLEELITEVRSVSATFTLEVPPPEVWARIRQRLDLAPSVRSALMDPTDAGPDPMLNTMSVPADRGQADGVRADAPRAPRDRQVVRQGGLRRSWVVPLAAVIALIVGVGGTLVVQRWLAPGETVVSSTHLAALPAWAGSTGQAELEVDSDGRRWLVVSVYPSRPVDGLQQVWLINNDVTAMLQVGLLSSAEQRFLLPAEVDVRRYPVVDISDEPPTDDGAHSGNSIVRGVLPL